MSTVLRRCTRTLAAAATVLALAACGSDSTSPPTGSLAVTISALAGSTGNVTVGGPGGYSKVLTASTTLTGLTVGTYTVTGALAVSTGPIVGTDTTTAIVSGSPATVAKNQTASVTVTYGVTTQTGGLWIGNSINASSYELLEFGASQLVSSASPVPVATIVGQNTNNDGVAVAFDRQGNLWSVNSTYGNNQITEYTTAQLDSTNPTPVLTLTISGAFNVQAIAFDSAGDLWMPDPLPCYFYEFKAGTLASHSGVVTLAPDVSIQPACNAFVGNPIGIAFDKNWNMWVTDNGFVPDSMDLYEYPADSLVAGFSGLYATRVIGGIHDIGYPAFDATGNLWMTGEDSVLFEYTAAQLADTTTAPPPHVSLGLATGTLLEGLALDNSGNVWMVDRSLNAVYELSTSQLAASGTNTTPAVTLGSSNNSLFAPWGIAFEPHASGLPLFSRVPKVARIRAKRH